MTAGVVLGAAVVTGAAASWTSARLFDEVVGRLADQRPDALPARVRWQRTNHRGEPVSLLEGPALAAGALLTLSLPLAPARLRAAGAVAVAGAAALGALDDLAGDGGSKGLRGHLGALRRGRVTTGSVKVAGLALTGAAAAAMTLGGRRSRAADVLVAGAVIAGTANLANLLDLRPGRALKAVLLVAPAVRGAGGPLVAVAAGVAVGVLADDLAETSMLGDTGANAVGALLGSAVVASTGRRGCALTLLALAALTLASERVSFSAVIDRTPGLRELDRLGRHRSPAQGLTQP